LYPDSKNRAIPSLHRDSFLPKVTGLYPVLRQVTQTPHIAGPLAQIFQTHELSPRAFYNLFHLEKIISALLPGLALARETIGQPADTKKIC
jgi:hypothetical protein